MLTISLNFTLQVVNKNKHHIKLTVLVNEYIFLQIIAGCAEHTIEIIAIQEHRLTSTNPINYKRLGDWILAHTKSSVEYHGVSHLYYKRIVPLILADEHLSDRIIATHINGVP